MGDLIPMCKNALVWNLLYLNNSSAVQARQITIAGSEGGQSPHLIPVQDEHIFRRLLLFIFSISNPSHPATFSISISIHSILSVAMSRQLRTPSRSSGALSSSAPSGTLPLGDLIETVSLNDLNKTPRDNIARAVITGAEVVSSYNWIKDGASPKIMIPGNKHLNTKHQLGIYLI